MGDNDRHSLVVPKFCGTADAWHSYQQKLTFFLQAKDLDDMLESTTPTATKDTPFPTPQSPQITDDTSRRRSKKARAYILMGMPDDILNSLVHLDTASAVWHTLKQIYERKSRSSLLRALKAYWKLQKEDDETATKWIARVQAAVATVKAHNIAAAFSAISDQDVIMRILAGLPEGFDTLLHHLDASETAESMINLTISGITSMIINQENSLNEREEAICDTKGIMANSTQEHIQNQVAIQVAAAMRAMSTTKQQHAASKSCKRHPNQNRHDDAGCYDQNPHLAPAGCDSARIKTTTAR